MTIFRANFGCLPFPNPVEWSWGSATPLEDQEETWREFVDTADPQLHLRHPPIIHVTRGDAASPVPGTRREAGMYPIPSSHRMELRGPFREGDDPERIRYGTGGFAVLALGFLAGYRTQFEGWRLFDALNTRRDRWFFTTPQGVVKCMDMALPTWTKLDGRGRAMLLNILHQRARIPGISFDWDRYLWSYLTVDACVNLVGRMLDQNVRGLGGLARWKFLAGQFGMSWTETESKEATELNDLRHTLFHEMRWGDSEDLYGRIGHDYPRSSLRPELRVTRFADRVILGVLGIEAGFIRTPWASGRGVFSLDLEG